MNYGNEPKIVVCIDRRENRKLLTALYLFSELYVTIVHLGLSKVCSDLKILALAILSFFVPN